MKPGVYVASRASIPERSAMWRRLRDGGAPIVSSWIDEAGPGETASMLELWERIAAEVAESVGVVLYVEFGDLPLKGALVECGMALALGKIVVVVMPGSTEAERRKLLGSWIEHPSVLHATAPEVAIQMLTSVEP